MAHIDTQTIGRSGGSFSIANFNGLGILVPPRCLQAVSWNHGRLRFGGLFKRQVDRPGRGGVIFFRNRFLTSRMAHRC